MSAGVAGGAAGGGVAVAAGGAGAPAGGVATRVQTCGVLPIVATARSMRPPRPSKLIVESVAFGDAEARRRDRDQRQRRRIATGRRRHQLLSVEHHGERRPGLLVAVAADVGLQRRPIDAHRRCRRLDRHRRQLLLDERDDLGVVDLLGACERRAEVGERQLRRCEGDRDERHVAALDRLLEDAGRALGPALEEQRHDRGLVVHHRHVDGAHLVEGVLGVDVGAAGDEQLDDLEVALVGGEGQRGRAVACLRVHVGPLVECRRDLGRVPGARRRPQILADGAGDWRSRLLSCGGLGRCAPGIAPATIGQPIRGNVIGSLRGKFYAGVTSKG